MDAALLAWLSSPAGKIIRAVSVFICFHFKEGGLPPNCCDLALQTIKKKQPEISSFRMAMKYLLEVTEESVCLVAEKSILLISIF